MFFKVAHVSFRTELQWPEDVTISPEAKDFIAKLLVREPSKRLGANGIEEVKSHPWFDGIEWDTLLSKPLTDFVPNPESKTSTTYHWGNVLFYLRSFLRFYKQTYRTL